MILYLPVHCQNTMGLTGVAWEGELFKREIQRVRVLLTCLEAVAFVRSSRL